MKNLFTRLLFLIGFIIYVALLSNADGAPVGVTGAPGEETCGRSDCHATSPNTGNATINIGLNTDATAYIPGNTHNISVSIENPKEAMRNGFEIVALDAQNNDIGEWIVAGEYTQTKSANGRNYVTHSEDGSILTSWQIAWKAPTSNVGMITFYAAVNDADDNGGRTGDDIYTTSLSVPAEIASSVTTLSSLTAVKVYPNPIQSDINLQLTLAERTTLTGTLINTLGQSVGQLFDQTLPKGETSLSVASPTGLTAGHYFLQLSNEIGDVKTIAILKE